MRVGIDSHRLRLFYSNCARSSIFTAPHELAASTRLESGDHATELTKSPGFSPGAASPPDPPAAVTAKLCFAMGVGTHRA